MSKSKAAHTARTQSARKRARENEQRARTRDTADRAVARQAQAAKGETGVVASENQTDSTMRHGLASPNRNLRPALTANHERAMAEGRRAPQPLPRPGKTSGRQLGDEDKPTLNPTPRASALSRARARTGREDADATRERTQARLARFQKVRALEMGYFDHIRRRPGDVFWIHKEEDFSERWMEPVSDDTPDRVTLGQQAVNQQHDEILALRAQQGIQTGRDDVPADIEDDGRNPLGE